MKVILDTNFLLLPLQAGLDIYAELDKILIEEPKYQLVTLDSVVAELEKLEAEGNLVAPKSRKLAKLKNVEVHTSDKVLNRGLSRTDNQILSIAGSGDIICTLDSKLRSAARKLGIRVITMRSGYIEEV